MLSAQAANSFHLTGAKAEFSRARSEIVPCRAEARGCRRFLCRTNLPCNRAQAAHENLRRSRPECEATFANRLAPRSPPARSANPPHLRRLIRLKNGFGGDRS